MSQATGRSAVKEPRIWNAAGFIPFQLEVLSPVYVGSGENFSPLEYVIVQEGDGYWLCLVDTGAWLLSQAENRDLQRALENGDMAALRRQISAESGKAQNFGVARVRFADAALAMDLLEAARGEASASKAEIAAFCRNPYLRQAFVPGSSLKGAISTPLLNFLDRKRRQAGQPGLFDAWRRDGKRQGQNYAYITRGFFGSITEHAMQALKIADIAIAPGGTAIGRAKEVGLAPDGPDQSRTPKLPCEALTPPGKDALPLYGNMRLDCRGGSPGISLFNGQRISLATLRQICNEFYLRRFNEEWEKFYSKNHLRSVRDALEPVRERLGRLDGSRDLLLRVGHYSHIESVTLELGAERPAPPRGFGKTRTLCSASGQALPFGWVILRQCAMEEYNAGVEAVQQKLASLMRSNEEMLARHRAELDERLNRQAEALYEQRRRRQEQQEARRLQARAEAERRQRAEDLKKAREAELANLSPDERLIRCLGYEDVSEERASELYGKFDSLGDLQLPAAEALKAYWQRVGKWQDKKLAEKQKKKVARIREFLGE